MPYENIFTLLNKSYSGKTIANVEKSIEIIQSKKFNIFNRVNIFSLQNLREYLWPLTEKNEQFDQSNYISLLWENFSLIGIFP